MARVRELYVPDIEVTYFLTSSEFEQNEEARSLIEEIIFFKFFSSKLSSKFIQTPYYALEYP